MTWAAVYCVAEIVIPKSETWFLTSVTVPEGITIIATGPLTSEEFSKEIGRLTGREKLFFYDAAAPIVLKESINMEKAFTADRYGKGESDYINCPMTKEEYEGFYE